MTLPFPFGLSLIPLPTPAAPDRREFVDGNNQIQNARYINPLSMDYELSDNGNFVGENLVNQQVYLALETTLGQAMQSNLGSALKSIKIITPNIIAKVSKVVNLSLSNLINAGSITLTMLQVTIPSPNQIAINVGFVNNTVGVAATSNVVVNIPG